LTGNALDATLGAEWWKAVHPDDRAVFETAWIKAAQSGSRLRVEHRYLRPNGETVWVQTEAVEERDAGGRLRGYVGTAADITELRQIREALQRSHDKLDERVRERTERSERMRSIVDASVDAIISTDVYGRIMSWNKAAEAIFGYTEAEALGRTTYFITPPDKMEEAIKMKARVRRGERVSEVETVRTAFGGELIDVSITMFGLTDSKGNHVGSSGILRDIRERKKAERGLKQLSGRLLRLQDEERRRLARELHDSTAQSVAALSLNLSMLTKAGMSLTQEHRASLLADTLALADSVSRELRTQSYLLHPPLLDERGLRSALCWFVEGFTARSGIHLNVDIAPEIVRLDPVVELTIFRVVQESLSNVHRHSRSEVASIRLTREKTGIVLEIRDRGCGIPDRDAEHTGVGIAGMKERLAHLGGTLVIEPNHPGVAVIARLSESV
jgi:two-component system NarL family sensor kinase